MPDLTVLSACTIGSFVILLLAALHIIHLG